MDSVNRLVITSASEAKEPAGGVEQAAASVSGRRVTSINPEQDPSKKHHPFISSRFLFPESTDYGSWPLKEPPEKGEYLLGRTVALKLSETRQKKSFYRSQPETDYLLSQKRAPKPATLLVPGLPVNLHLDNLDLALLLKKGSDQVLAAYKLDAGTKPNADLNQLELKRISGAEELENKLREINLRRFPCLPDQSWGGIDGQGQVKAPTTKEDTLQSCLDTFQDRMTENEVILAEYKPSDILATMLVQDMPLLVQNGLKMPVTHHLDMKKALEQDLGIKPLPVVFYNQYTGQITSSISAEEADELNHQLKELAPFAAILPCDPSSLPAFFENGFDKKYLDGLKQLTDEMKGLLEHGKGSQAPSVERLNSLLKKIEKGDATADTYLEFADFPHDLIRYREVVDDSIDAPAGGDSYRQRMLLIKLLAFHTAFNSNDSKKGTTHSKLTEERHFLSPSELNRAENWQEYLKANQERLSVIDRVIDQSGIAEKVRGMTKVQPLDFTQNPYMAMHWLKNYCHLDTSDEAVQGYLSCAVYFIQMLDHKLSLKERQQYFRDILAPLFQQLVEQSSCEVIKLSISKLLQNFNRCLMQWIVQSKEAFHELATLNGQLIRGMEAEDISAESIPDSSILVNDIKLLFNTIALMTYFYESHYPDDKTEPKRLLSQAISSLKNVNQMLIKEQFGRSFFSRLNFPVNRKEFARWMQSTAGPTESDKQCSATNSKVTSLSAKPEAPASADNKEALPHQTSLRHTLQKVIEHYYLSPHPAQLSKIFKGLSVYERGSLWRSHHGVDHIARTVILQEAVISLHKQSSPKYRDLFQRHPELDKLLSLAIAYHDVMAEIAPKSEEEPLAAEALKRDLAADHTDTTVNLVISALRNKNVNTMESVGEGYTSDEQVCADERLIRRLLRLPDSIDIARVKEVIPEESFSPSEGATPARSSTIYSMDWMDLDQELVSNPDFMVSWTALMRTSVFWAGSTGAPPANAKSLSPADVMPYSPCAELLPWNDIYSEQRRQVIARDADSIGYTRERLNDIVRFYVAQQAGRPVGNLFQLRQIKLPDDWTTLDSFAHFTEGRQQKLAPLIEYWWENPFKHHYGTLTQTLLDSPAVRNIVREDREVSQCKRQRGYAESGEPKYETLWEVSERRN